MITVPDFNRFLRREAGVDCGLVLDCQKALEINLAIYHDTTLTDEEKSHMYITYDDFPRNSLDYFNWREIIDLKDGDTKIPFRCNFRTYTAVCYTINDDFADFSNSSCKKETAFFIRYIPNTDFCDNINEDFRPLQTMSVELEFAYARIFPWYVVGQIYPKRMVTEEEASNLVDTVKEALALYFAPANREFGQKPTVMEVVEVIEGAHSNIRYFDAGSLTNPIINYGMLVSDIAEDYILKFDDLSYFNPISFAKYTDIGDKGNIRVAPEWIITQ